ncbi:MAG: OmpA family protein [Pseudomonadota bacterium]|nr:OmpA family protein [Pseudomonadota bacterium]
MSEATPSVSKTLSWLLLIILIGVVSLYTWYQGTLEQGLTDKDAEIAQAAQRLKDTDEKLGLSLATEKDLRAEVDALHKQHQAEKQGLMGKLDAADQTHQDLLRDMEGLRSQHAEVLAAEQQKARQTYAELEGRHEAANQQIAALGTDIDQLKQQMSDAAAAHRTQEQQLEQQLNERITFYRTALEGSEPDRAAQLAGLEQQAQADRQALDTAHQALQAMAATGADLEQRLGNATRAVEEKNQALADAGRKLEGLQSELTRNESALAALQSKYDAALADFEEQLAAIQQQLQGAEADHTRTKAEATVAMKEAKDAHASQMAEAEGRISALTQNLKSEQATLSALQQKHDSMVSELRGTIDATQQTLSGVEAELSAATQAAAKAQEAHAKQIEEAQAQVAGLQETLESERQQAEKDRLTSQRESAAALTHVRGLYTKFSELGGRATDQGMLLSLADADLRFRTSKADLPDGELPSLDRIAALLVEHPNLTTRIEGHTDSSGRDETNLELSQKRADAVKQALVDRGVAVERVVSEGIGEARPIADNKSSIGRRQNRRVEIYVIEN